MSVTKRLEDESPLILVRSGGDHVSINFQPLNKGNYQKEELQMSSIFVSMGGVELEIRKGNPPQNKIQIYQTQPVKKDEQPKSKPAPPHWDYSTVHGPKMWPTIFPQIQYKKFQSPILIFTDQSLYEPNLPRNPITFEISENCCEILENTGHSFQVSGQGFSCITGGPVRDEYEFLQFHMHWGTNDDEGSEHIIDGIHSPGELHIVAWNRSKYRSAQEAIASENFNGLLVFGILIKIIPTDNHHMNRLIDRLSMIRYQGEKINLIRNTISLKDLLPEYPQNYFTYNGSLTTPMCNESVRWIVFQNKLGLSRNQLNQLRQLKHVQKGEKSIDENIRKNFRPLMPLNGRTVYRSFP